MKLAQTNLSKLAETRPAVGLVHRSADFQVCCIAGFQTRMPSVNPMPQASARPADLEIGDTAGLETCATTCAVAPASWTAPALRRFSRAGQKAAEGCRSPKPSGSSHVSLTPRLQPGVRRSARIENLFNGFSPRAEAVETAGNFSAKAFHRAEATVLMRAAAAGRNFRIADAVEI